jgi:hypothetical protein
MSKHEANIDAVYYEPEVPQEIKNRFDPSLYKRHLMEESLGEFLLEKNYFVKNGKFFLDLIIKSCKIKTEKALSFQYKNGAWALQPTDA